MGDRLAALSGQALAILLALALGAVVDPHCRRESRSQS